MSPLLPLLLALFVALWFIIFDADFITFSYDLHRQILGNNKIAKKTVWIVGASSGIGESLVYELIQSGCRQLILSSRREKQLKRVRAKALTLNTKIAINDIKIIIKPLDLLDFATKDAYNDEFVNALMKDIPFDTIDILVVNSGMIQFGYAIDNDISILQRVSQINTIGPIALIQAMIRYWHKTDAMHSNHYQIALTSSVAGVVGSPRQSAYSMSKFAINGYLQTLRMELIGDNIDINIVNPGHIELNKYSNEAKSASLESKGHKRGDGGVSKGRMTLKRCAQLYVTVVEYSITESIISTQPILLFAYVRQHLSGFWNPITKLVVPIFDKHYKKP